MSFFLPTPHFKRSENIRDQMSNVFIFRWIKIYDRHVIRVGRVGGILWQIRATIFDKFDRSFVSIVNKTESKYKLLNYSTFLTCSTFRPISQPFLVTKLFSHFQRIQVVFINRISIGNCFRQMTSNDWNCVSYKIVLHMWKKSIHFPPTYSTWKLNFKCEIENSKTFTDGLNEKILIRLILFFQ